MPEVFITAHDAVFSQAGCRPGERLLVHGAAGGVGTAAVQLGRAAGAGVARGCGRGAARGGRGARRAARSSRRDSRRSGPFDVMLELVGAGNLAGERQGARDRRPDRRDRGGGSGAKAELNLVALMGNRGRIHASTLRARPLEEKARSLRAGSRGRRCRCSGAGALRVPVAETYPLDQAEPAYERFAPGASSESRATPAGPRAAPAAAPPPRGARRPVGGVGDQHRRLDHRAEQQVRERRHLARRGIARVHRLLQRRDDEPQPVRASISRHSAQPSTAGASRWEMRITAGSVQASRKARTPVDQLPRVGDAGDLRADRSEQLESSCSCTARKRSRLSAKWW